MMLKTGFALAISVLALGTAPTSAADVTPANASIPSKTLNERLIEATRDGHSEAVEALLRDGAKVEARDDSLRTPLIVAASSGNVAIVQALLKAGADVNARNVNGSTALMGAALTGNAGVIRILLDAKAQVNSTNNMGRTALHFAARRGVVEIMELLLAARAVVSDQPEGGSPLDQAVIGGHADAIRCLLRHRALVNGHDKKGTSPLDHAMFGGDTNVVQILLDAGAEIDARHATDGETALMWAAQSEQVAVLQLLIRSHADLNKTDNQGWTALMWAKSSGQDEAAKILKLAGGEERTNLSYAAATGDLASLRSLLATNGVSPPTRGEIGNALYRAVEYRQADAVKELLVHDANPNAQLEGDWTVLLSACRGGEVGIARQLLAAGADVNLPRGNNGDTPLMEAAGYTPVDFVSELIAKGAQVNVVTKGGDTAAGWAALGAKLDNLKVLVQHGAEVNIHVGEAEGWPGWPLITASSGGHLPIVDYLLAHGADIDIRDSHGKTALMYAVERGKVDVVKLLIARGADMFAKADYDYNNTALKLAENTGKTEIVPVLHIMDFENRHPSDPRHWGAKLKRSLGESTQAHLANRPPDNAGLLALTKEIVTATDASPTMKADARYLVAMADLETLKASGPVSNAVARAAIEADIHQFQKNYPDDTRAATVQQQWDALQRRWVADREAHAQTPLDLKFKAVDDTDVDMAKLRGKVVLVDFWATWCGPCRAEIPKVVTAYNQLHKDGFEVIGISLDQDKQRLVDFTKQAGMTWPQYFDGKGWENAISTRYGIDSIPAMWLVDKKGYVRSTEARGDDLAAQVKKLLAE